MEFALNQSGFPVDELEENIRLIAEAGYDGFEPNLTSDGPLRDDDGVARVDALAEEYGLTVPSISTTIHWDYPLTSPETEVRDAGLRHATRMLEVADSLGADTVLIVPGVLQAVPDYDDAYEAALRAVRELARTAPSGVTVAVENVGNGLLLSPREFASFVDAASDAGDVGAYFDVGNALYYDQHPAHWIRHLNDRIAKVHVKGYDNDAGITYPLQGDVDWEAVAGALDDIGYDGWITAEVPPYESRPELTPRHVLESIREALGARNAFESS